MKVEHLVVDTNAFVNNLPLHELGENIYTTREVIAEIRDSATKQRIEVLPYEICYKEPQSEYVQLVTKLSKVTGDYTCLSAVDIQLIALAYQISKEKLGPDASARLLKTVIDAESVKNVTVLGSKQVHRESESEKSQESSQVNKDEERSNETTELTEGNKNEDSSDKDENEDTSSTDDEEDDEEEGWITPSNYKQKVKEMEDTDGAMQEPDESTPVACLTNDFSMQNLMLHIGIKVLSSNGMLIRQLRTYILRCYTCYQTTSKMEKIFCPNCGHKTLKRVSVTVNPDGTRVIHLSRRVNLTGRGKKYPLPMPKGGKHSNNPILAEDQPIPQQRMSKHAMQKINPIDFNYVAGASPFVTKDIYSRAAMVGVNFGGKNYWDKKNPNEARKSCNKKKRNV